MPQFNGVIALHLLGSHVLSIHAHTIELHLCDDAFRPQPIRPLKYHLPFPLHHRSVSVSDVVPVPTQIQDRRWKFNLLAYDGHSLAYYTVAIELPGATDATPAMDVTLIGEVRPPPTRLQPLTRSPWFVSAHALGPQGIRAMWVDRDNLTMTRHVRLCTLNRNDTQHEMDTASNVFSLASYDLRGEPFNQSRFADRVHRNYRGSDALRARRTQWIRCLGKSFRRRLSSTSQTLAERVQLNVADERNGAGQRQQRVNFYLNLIMMSFRQLVRAKPRFINGRLRSARSEYGEPCFGANKKRFDFRKLVLPLKSSHMRLSFNFSAWHVESIADLLGASIRLRYFLSTVLQCLRPPLV
jgi:hypothetical protein